MTDTQEAVLLASSIHEMNYRAAMTALENVKAERDQLRAELKKVRVPEFGKAVAGLVDDIDGLIGESSGVYGLHLNGDPSPWDELIEGGRFERLTHLELVRSMLPAAPTPPHADQKGQ